jgi:hypothetical protein
MIIADFECQACGNISEEICNSGKKRGACPECGKPSKRIISFGKVYTGNQDAPWLKSVLEVVDKESPKRHVQNFVKNPTRDNYKAWMKGEGIRPADHTEHGAPPVYQRPRVDKFERERLTRDLFEKHRARKAISVNS